MRSAKPLIKAFAVLVALLVIGGACSDDDETNGTVAPDDGPTIRLQLPAEARGQFAGYFAAKDKGFYEAEGLNVEIVEGPDNIVLDQLVSGDAEFGVTWVRKALVAREAGSKVVNISQLFQRTGTREVSWADSEITEPAHWAGKTVGTWGFGNEFELTAAINRFGVTKVNLVQHPFDMLALLDRGLDAAQAMIYDEYAELLETSNPDTGQLYESADFNVIDFNELGTAMLQDGVWANEDWLAVPVNEDIAERFLRATHRGWIFCRDNFNECLNVVLANGTDLGSSHQAWQLNEVNALIWPSFLGLGIMDDALWDQSGDVAVSEGLIATLPTSDGFRTDLAERAVAALEDAGADVKGAEFEKRTVALNPGGS